MEKFKTIWKRLEKSKKQLKVSEESMKDDILFQIVKKQIDAIDVYDLLAGGAPKDEFDSESKMIATRIEKGMTAYRIAEIIAQVMNEQFEEIFSTNEFMSYAEAIEKFLNNT